MSDPDCDQAGRPRRGRRRPGWAVVAAALVLLPGCGSDGPPHPAPLSPADLAFGQEDYDGKLVETRGVVRRFGPDEGATRLHFVVEDAELNRTRLDGGAPERFVGQEVTVVGRFRYSDDTGRRIEVERISAPPPAG